VSGEHGCNCGYRRTQQQNATASTPAGRRLCVCRNRRTATPSEIHRQRQVRQLRKTALNVPGTRTIGAHCHMHFDFPSPRGIEPVDLFVVEDCGQLIAVHDLLPVRRAMGVASVSCSR
jgi:hypothetical protein